MEKCIRVVSNCITSFTAPGLGSAAGTLSPALQKGKSIQTYSKNKCRWQEKCPLKINALYAQIKRLTYHAGDTASFSTGFSICS